MSRVLPLQSDSSDSQEIPRGGRGAWQGGPCHQCGDDMPANLVHCQTCRALLNSELTEDSVEIKSEPAKHAIGQTIPAFERLIADIEEKSETESEISMRVSEETDSVILPS